MLEKEIAMSLRRTNKYLGNILKEQIEESNLSFRLFNMLVLIRKDPTISQKEMATNLKLSQGAISGSIKRLLSKGYLIVEPLESDNRYKRLVLSDEAIAIVDKNKKLLDEKFIQICAGFTDTERELLNDLLARMGDNLKRMHMVDKE